MREWSTLRKLMLLKGATGAPLNEYTATGNPLTFNTNKAKPLKSALATWQPHQSGSGDPSPENVRPISGMDGVTVWHTGKNLLDPSKCTKQGRDNLWWYKSEGSLLKAGTYTFSFERRVTGFYVYDFNTGANLRTRYNSPTDTFTLAEDHVVKINVYISGEVSIDEKAQLELGSTATAYEPYSGTSYSVAFPSSVGIVYGGTLDLTTGVLTAEYMQKVSDGSVADDWSFGESVGLHRAIIGVAKFGDYPPKANSTANLRTNYLKNSAEQQACNAFIGSTSNFLCYAPDGITTKADWLAYLAENPLQIVYELAEPVVIATLSPTQISALLGNNTMWADADGDIEVKYLKKG